MASTPTVTVEHTAPTSIAELDEIIKQKNAVELIEIADPDKLVRSVVEVVSVPEGRKLQSLKPLIDEYLPNPRRRRGTATLLTTSAFVAHVERHRDADRTVCFADPAPAQPSVTAVFNYHKAGGEIPAAGTPGWGDHRAVCKLRMSDEWKAWLGVHGRDLAQDEFAAFLQDRMGDLILVDSANDPKVADTVELLQARLGGPTAIMALSRGIEVRAAAVVRNAVTLETGEVQVSYVESHTGESGAPITTPTLFFITIPVFYAGTPYRIPVRIRYRVRGGALSWSLHLYRHDRVFEDAFEGVLKEVREALALPVYIGTPEV